ncbi:hypothetical protein BDI01nite_22460 [Brevundimonas diminuta]|nr:hypothetical protein BDI01nite_22460 [Brevundimonas diminuta]
MTADLSALIARLEAAEVGSRELDGAICAALGEQPEWATKNHAPTQPQLWTDGKPGLHAREWLCPRYTTSLDTGLALAERLPGWVWNMGNDTRCWAHLWNDLPTYDGNPSMGRAATPALALCIAILRAKQGEGE